MEKSKIDNIRTDDELIFNVLPPPQGIIRWGIVFLMLLGFVLIAVAWIIPYRQTVSVSFDLSSTNTPSQIVASQAGIITSIPIQDGQEVKQGTPLVVLSCPKGITSKKMSQVQPQTFAFAKQDATTETVRVFAYARTIAPADGKVFIPKLWVVGEQVKANEPLMLLLPNQPNRWVARIQINASDKLKVRVGQKVVMPTEGGQSSTTGYISQISQWQENGLYKALVTLPEDTSYPLKTPIKGNAQVVLKESTLLQQIFSQMKSLWTK